MGSVCKLTFRSIRSFLGRYMALLLIVMLSVGFFSGLKITKDAMAYTGEKYLAEQNFYDYRVAFHIGLYGNGRGRAGKSTLHRVCRGDEKCGRIGRGGGRQQAFPSAFSAEKRQSSFPYGRKDAGSGK